MGYVDKQIAAYRKTIGDAVAGKGLQRAIKALQEKSKIKDSLKPLPARGAITAKRKTAKRTAGTSTAGYTELSRAYYTTTRELRSSDGLFVLQWHALSTWVTKEGVTFTYADYNPDA